MLKKNFRSPHEKQMRAIARAETLRKAGEVVGRGLLIGVVLDGLFGCAYATHPELLSNQQGSSGAFFWESAGAFLLTGEVVSVAWEGASTAMRARRKH